MSTQLDLGTQAKGVLGITDGGTSSNQSPGINGRTVTGTTDTILCDTTGPVLRDRANTVIYNNGSGVTVTLPDPSTSGCGANFAVLLVNIGAGTVTVNRASSATFTTLNGLTGGTGSTSFTLSQWDYATVSSPDNSTWLVRKVDH